MAIFCIFPMDNPPFRRSIEGLCFYFGETPQANPSIETPKKDRQNLKYEVHTVHIYIIYTYIYIHIYIYVYIHIYIYGTAEPLYKNRLRIF